MPARVMGAANQHATRQYLSRLPFSTASKAFQHCLKAFQDCEPEAGKSIAALRLQDYGRCLIATTANSGSQPHLPFKAAFQHCLKAF